MIGGLRYPVRMRVLDGKTVVFQTTILGLRSADESVSTYIADDNAKYKVEWSQCGNEHAPRSVAGEEQEGKARDKGHERTETEGLAYVCGESKVYATTALETKKGDRSSHLIHFTPPPNPECWASEPAKPAAAAPDAGAPDAAAAPAPAIAEDAGASGAAAPAASDAGPAASDAGAAAPPDAGAKH